MLSINPYVNLMLSVVNEKRREVSRLYYFSVLILDSKRLASPLLPLKRFYRYSVNANTPYQQDEQLMGNIAQACAFKGYFAHGIV